MSFNQYISSMDIRQNYMNQQEHERQRREYSQNRHNRIKVESQMIKPIVDMKSAYSEVRKSKVTLNKNMVSATSCRRV